MIHVSRDTKLPDELNLVRIRRIAAEVFTIRNYSGDASLVFTKNETLQKFNREYRNVDNATDVLSFPSDEIDPDSGVRYLGDVIISTEKAFAQSLQAGKPYLDELTMLIVHGCLHLTGLDHTLDAEKQNMKTNQEFILQKLGIENFSWPEED